MSTDSFPELSVLRLALAPQTRDRHLAEVVSAIRSAPHRRSGFRLSWRRWVASAAAAGALLTPAAAIAADGALPGDALYPIKRLLEPVVRLVDRDVIAEHRVEELEVLIARDGSSDIVTDLLIDARAAVGAVDVPELRDRLAAIEEVIDQRTTDRIPASTDRPRVDTPPVDPPVTTSAPADAGHPTDGHAPAPAPDLEHRDSVAPPEDSPPAVDAPSVTTAVLRDGTTHRDGLGGEAADVDSAPAEQPVIDEPAHDAPPESGDTRETDAPTVDGEGDRAP